MLNEAGVRHCEALKLDLETNGKKVDCFKRRNTQVIPTGATHQGYQSHCFRWRSEDANESFSKHPHKHLALFCLRKADTLTAGTLEGWAGGEYLGE